MPLQLSVKTLPVYGGQYVLGPIQINEFPRTGAAHERMFFSALEVDILNGGVLVTLFDTRSATVYGTESVLTRTTTSIQRRAQGGEGPWLLLKIWNVILSLSDLILVRSRHSRSHCKNSVFFLRFVFCPPPPQKNAVHASVADKLEEKRMVLGVFLDVSAASNCIRHSLFLAMLESGGASNFLLVRCIFFREKFLGSLGKK